MKKQLTVVLLVFVLAVSLMGCAAASAVQKLDAAEDQIEEKLDRAEDKLEQSIRNAVPPAEKSALPAQEPATPAIPAQEPAAPATEPVQVPPPVENTDKLTEEQALQIALDYVGFTADQVSRVRTEFEVDDGIPQYDVEFLQGDWEYEFEIHGKNGKIISYDKDHKYD